MPRLPKPARLFPFLKWLPVVNRSTLKRDFFAGLTGSVIVLPQGIAFALIAGLPPIYGLYTAMIPPIVAALFGSSHHLISGPTTAISIVLFATVSKIATPYTADYISLVITLTFVAGVYQLILGFARMGSLVNFVSHSVVVGFTVGAAILIVTSQMSVFTGIPMPPGMSFASSWGHLWENRETFNPYILSVSLITLASGIFFRVWRPALPGMLFAMIIGALAAFLLGGEKRGIDLVGEISGSLPSLTVPDFSFESLRVLGSAALAVAVLGLLEAVSIARSVGLKSGQRIESNQEFIGQGLANVVGSFFSCFASSGSFTRTGVNYDAGAATPLSAVMAALSLLVIVLLVAPLLAYLPMPAMAGILLLVAWRLVDFHHIFTIVRTANKETAIMLTTCVATLLVELEFAIYVGVIMSLIIYLMRTSRPRVVSRVPDPRTYNRIMVTNPKLPECPQLKIVRIEGSLFFGAVDHVQKSLQLFGSKNPEQTRILIIGNAISFIDYSGAELLAQEGERLRKQGGGLYLVKVTEEIRQFLQRGGFDKRIGEDHIFPSKGEAVEKIFARLDRERCLACSARIFNECKNIEGPAPADEKRREAHDIPDDAAPRRMVHAKKKRKRIVASSP